MEWALRMAIRLEWSWLESLLYRWLCPSPIFGAVRAKQCVARGYCGCDNALRYPTTPRPRED